jgi:hypothetical protein
MVPSMTPLDPLEPFALALQLGRLAVPARTGSLGANAARRWLRDVQGPGGLPFTALEHAVPGDDPRVALGIVGPDGVLVAARWVRLAHVPAWLAARHAVDGVVGGWP